ncbi:ATP-dependent protease ATPase subunit HslU [Bienertia sinuspersici]
MINHRSLLERTNVGVYRLVYLGGKIKTFQVDPDQLCGFWLKELVLNCGSYEKVECVYYLMPGMALEEGLKKVYTDDEVRAMADVATQQRSINLYVYHEGDSPESLIISLKIKKPNRPPKRPVKPQGPLRRSPRSKYSNKESGAGDSCASPVVNVKAVNTKDKAVDNIVPPNQVTQPYSQHSNPTKTPAAICNIDQEIITQPLSQPDNVAICNIDQEVITQPLSQPANPSQSQDIVSSDPD